MELFIPGPAGMLEAKLDLPEGDPRAAIAVCHPHPLYGGTMNTTVVFRMAKAFQEAGLAVLRFNFRGVSESEGDHHGRGGEEGDLQAALDHLQSRFKGLELWAGGFSFGARTSASLARREPRVVRIALAALPVEAFDCSFVTEVEQPGLILMAGKDEYGTLAKLRELFPDLHAGLELDEIPDVDHFFQGSTKELQARFRTFAERSLEPAR